MVVRDLTYCLRYICSTSSNSTEFSIDCDEMRKPLNKRRESLTVQKTWHAMLSVLARNRGV